MEGTVGTLVEVNCETDFVARTDDFKELCKDIAMQICAMNPLYVKKEDVPAELIEKEKQIYREEALKTGKPEKVAGKIVDGKVEKFLKDVLCFHRCTLFQTRADLLNQTIRFLLKRVFLLEFLETKVFTQKDLGSPQKMAPLQE